MKTDIHPQYFNQAKITCSCGQVMTMGSTKNEVHVEICSNCHPFFTGAEKILDTAGRVEKFKRKRAKAAASTGSTRSPQASSGQAASPKKSAKKSSGR